MRIRIQSTKVRKTGLQIFIALPKLYARHLGVEITGPSYPRPCPHAPGPLADAGQLVAKVNIKVVLHYVIDFAHHNLPHRVAHLKTGFQTLNWIKNTDPEPWTCGQNCGS